MRATASAPGRVNLIGEHLDYNGGRCLAIALPLRTTATVTPSADGVLHVVAAARPYVAGVLAELGVPEGLVVGLESTVPIGAGLSSSAALLCSVALAVDALHGLRLSRDQLLDACVRAETRQVGAPTGGLDQAAALFARVGHALLLDFVSGTREQVPFFPAGVDLLVVDTRVAHAHVEGGYGDRRAACDRARDLLGLTHLVQATALEGLPDELVPLVRHVVSEQARVDAFVAAARDGDWAACGEMMVASHASLRDDFLVSCPELDLVVDTALRAGALGARMTGGGFGGSAVVLAGHDQVAVVRERVRGAFLERGLAEPGFHPGTASGPARVE